MTDILTKQDFTFNAHKRMMSSYVDLLEATVEAFERFALAKQVGPSEREYQAARKVLVDVGWLDE